MNDEILIPPTQGIITISNLLEDGIHRFLKATEKTIQVPGEFECIDEGLLQYNLIIRNIEAVALLAKHDQVLFPTAMGIARSTFEIAVRVLWMMTPKDAFIRESRWLSQIENIEEYNNIAVKFYREHGFDHSQFTQDRELILRFRQKLNELLIVKGHNPKRLPDLRDMLKEIGLEKEYIRYIVLSQFTHGTLISTSVYRMNFGNMKIFGEYITSIDWYGIFNSLWFCLSYPGKLLIERLGGNAGAFISLKYEEEVNDALKNLQNTT